MVCLLFGIALLAVAMYVGLYIVHCIAAWTADSATAEKFVSTTPNKK
jgi:hypothetical protein